jgi:ABC-type transporter Mla maintaining outer membrane lipid asymmetry ATPase subunit MlaF
MFKKRRHILSLDNVFLGGDILQTREPIPATNEILGGELHVLKLEHPGQSVVIGDLLSGLISPSQGRIRFLGRDWSGIAPDIANGLRGKIGRVHAAGVWMEKLTIQENILMQQLHHTRRNVETVHAEAVRLAADLGLPGLPTGFPSEALPGDLQRAAWIRAFLGSRRH